MTSPFERWRARDVTDLIAAYPLAAIGPGQGPAEATVMLPLVAELGRSGGVLRLIGHMGRGNRLRPLLEANPRARILFHGPQGYISPDMAGRRTWAPTWVYTQVRVDADVTFEPEALDEALEVLVEHVENGRAEPWRVDELGARAESLKSRIIAFSARPQRITATFKLGQDEAPETLSHILDSLGDCDLGRWMRRFNAERLPELDLPSKGLPLPPR